MANIILNEALGLGRGYIDNVDDGGAERIYIHALKITGDQDVAIRDLATVTITGLLALASVAEPTFDTPIAMDQDDITVTVDTTNDRVDVEYTNQTFSSVATETAWTDIILSYSAAGTDVDGSNIPFHLYDFSVTPNGGDITIDFVTTGDNFRVAQQ